MKDFMLTEVTRTAKYTEVYFDEFQKHYWQKELKVAQNSFHHIPNLDFDVPL